tara:strand:- start:993 stop:2063 length:1071 start_codon:yes stop_codon:yes gene_type:complete
MSTINFGTSVSLAEACDLAIFNPKKAYLWLSEPGCGKTSQLHAIKQRLGDAYTYVYFDMANKDIGDIGMPIPDRERKITEYYLNGIFQHYVGKPLVIIFDEWTKAPQLVQNALHPVLEPSGPRVLDWYIPDGSIRILTGNGAADGLGDNIKAHTLNRVTRLHVRKPSAEEWLAWAVNNDVDPVVMAWVDRFPHVLDSYMDGDQSSNPYIYNPKKMQTSYVSPRSLEAVSHSIKNRTLVSANAMLADMIGTIGESGARDLNAFVEYQDQLPTWEAVITSPKTAKLPDSPGACAVMVFGGVTRVDAASITPFMDYIERMEPEWQAAFAINLAKNPARSAVAFKSAKFRDWCQQNEDIL